MSLVSSLSLPVEFTVEKVKFAGSGCFTDQKIKYPSEPLQYKSNHLCFLRWFFIYGLFHISIGRHNNSLEKIDQDIGHRQHERG